MRFVYNQALLDAEGTTSATLVNRTTTDPLADLARGASNLSVEMEQVIREGAGRGIAFDVAELKLRPGPREVLQPTLKIRSKISHGCDKYTKAVTTG
jgi:hypothetical protein